MNHLINIPEEKLNNIFKHLTYIKENIETTNPKKFGDKMDMQINVEIIFDGKKYDIGFYTDYSGNNGHWMWDDEYEAEAPIYLPAKNWEDDDEPQYILRTAICDFLDKNYHQ
jgi:hypothetical protein